MKKTAPNFFSAKSAASSAIAVSAIAFPLSAQTASEANVSAQPLTLQSNGVERAAMRSRYSSGCRRSRKLRRATNRR